MNEGSVEGGQVLLITGEGFPEDDFTNLRVEIEGNDCDVTYSAYDKITCVTRKQINPQDILEHEGGPGLRREVWLNQSKLSIDFTSVIGIVEPDLSYITTTTQIPRDEDKNIRDRMYGYFRAPFTANYTFLLASDDSAQVFLGSNELAETAVQIINLSGYTGLRDQFYSGKQSAEIELVEGKNYYLEVRHIQGTGESHLNLGVKISSEGYHENQLPYIQRLQISAESPVYEVQTLKFFGAESAPTGGQLNLTYAGTKLDAVEWNIEAGK